MISYNVSNPYSGNNNSYTPPTYQPQTQPNQYQPNIYATPVAQPVAQPAVDNSVVKPIPVDIPQQNTIDASYQQYLPGQTPQIPTNNNSMNQSLLPNNQPQEQVRVGRFGIELLPPAYPMNGYGMPMNTNYDQVITLRSKNTWAYCSNCNCIIQTQIRTSCFLFAYLICFFSIFIVAFIAPDILAVIFPFFFILLVILIICAVVSQSKAMHYCPQCKQPIGRTGQTVRIPAQSTHP